MKIRQIVLVVSIVLTVSSQSTARLTLSVQGHVRSSFAGQRSLMSTPTSWTDLVTFENFAERAMIVPSGTDRPGPCWPVAERYETLGPGEARSTPSIRLVGMLLGDGAGVDSERSGRLMCDVSDITNLLLRQAFVAGVGPQNVAAPDAAPQVVSGINDGHQWSNNIGELNLVANPVPAPIAIVIGSIGVGLIGWMRICRTYTV
jgi:hypothetical protein